MVLFDTTGHLGPFPQQALGGWAGLQQGDFEHLQTRCLPVSHQVKILPY
jgi:hypothetical protein